MSVSLSKGGKVSLSKEAPNLTKIQVGLGWVERATDGQEFDLDASIFLLNARGKVRNDYDFVFYGNTTAVNGAVEHQGDNKTGGTGASDDEVIKIDLKAMEENASDVEKIAVVVTIHEAEQRGQSFGQVNNAFIRIVDDSNNKELARFDLTEEMSSETAMIFGEVYFKGGEWKFSAVGQGYAGGLASVCSGYGIDAA